MAVSVWNGFHADWALIAIASLKILTAWAKVTAIRPLMWQWKIAWNGYQGAVIFIGAGQGNRAKQRLRIGVLHFVENIFDTARFHRFTGVHHTNSVTGFQD